MEFIDRVSEKRGALMALAIMFVVVYHYKCWIGGFPWYIGSILKFGYIGVDIFFFLSGFGLACSFQKNNIRQFYKNRVIKILPCYFLYGVILLLNIAFQGGMFTWFDVLYKFSTLEYTFRHGGIDWFMCAIIQLYLLFPLIFFLVKKIRLLGVMFIFIVVYAVTIAYNFHWTHLAMLQRIPMFVMGVYCYVFRNKTKEIKYLVLFSFICFFALCVFADEQTAFLKTCCFTPTLLYAVTSNKMEKCLNTITMTKQIGGGSIAKNTLQIYYGTNLALLSYDWIDANREVKTLIFLLALVFGSYFFHWITYETSVFIKKI